MSKQKRGLEEMSKETENWLETHQKEYRRLEAIGDKKGARGVKFGMHVHKLRKIAKLTQEEAAKRAGISRVKWSQIENGSIPSSKTLTKIAEALSTEVAGLYRRLGYDTPRRLSKYGMRHAQKDFDVALMESENLAVFFHHLQSIWQQYKSEKHTLPKHRSLDPSHSTIIARVLENLPDRKRLDLALEIVRVAPTKKKKS